jgi:hypothetical protein
MMKKTSLLGILLSAALFGAACGGDAARKSRKLPSSISVEFPEGSAPVSRDLARRLAAIGVKSIFVPAVRGSAQGGLPHFEPMIAPDAPYTVPVYLEVQGLGNFDSYLDSAGGKAGEEIWRWVAPAISSPRWGKVAGLHLALNVTKSASKYGSALSVLRSRLPKNLTLSASIFSKPPESDASHWRGAAKSLDFAVAAVFGRVPDVAEEGFKVTETLADAGSLEVPVYAAYSPQGRGFTGAGGGGAQRVSDSHLNELSEDRRFDFGFGSLLSDADENVYVFSAKQDIPKLPWGAGPFRPGETITFRANRLSDLTAALSEAKASAGKIISLEALDDQDHVFGFSILEDLLLGRGLEPRLAFSRSATPGEINFFALNVSPEYSELSRLNNWIDVRFPDARFLDVKPGDCDRFEFVDEAGRQMVPGRAHIIRFFENFIAPGESMTAGPIRYSGDPRCFASAHFALPDGRMVTVPEVAVAEVPGAPVPPPESDEKRPGKVEHRAGRKR